VEQDLAAAPPTASNRLTTSHLRHAISKLGIRSRTELARFAALVERGRADEGAFSAKFP
jgi:hypothetical protein